MESLFPNLSWLRGWRNAAGSRRSEIQAPKSTGRRGATFVFSGGSTYSDLCQPDLATATNRLDLTIIRTTDRQLRIGPPEPFAERVTPSNYLPPRFHERPLRNRLWAIVECRRLVRAFSELGDLRLVVFEETARFPNRLLAAHLRSRGVAIGLLGVMVGDYSHPRWREGSRPLALMRRSLASDGIVAILLLPTRGFVWVLCHLLDKLASIFCRRLLGRRKRGKFLQAFPGGLAPFENPLGPVRPDVFFSSALGCTEEAQRFYGQDVTVIEFRDNHWLETVSSSTQTTDAHTLLILPRSTSAISNWKLDDYLDALKRSQIDDASKICVRFHPYEEQAFIRRFQATMRRNGFNPLISSGALWRDASGASAILAFGRSSASHFVARNFPAKTLWVDPPEDWETFMEDYLTRRSLAGALETFLNQAST